MYPNGTGMILPYVMTARVGGSSSQRNLSYRYADERGDGLVGVPVISNTTSFFHGEEFVDLSGAISGSLTSEDAASIKMENKSSLKINSAAVLGRNADGEYYRAWIGDFEQNAAKQIKLDIVARDDLWVPEWDNNPITRKRAEKVDMFGTQIDQSENEAELSIGYCLRRIIESSKLEPQQAMLVGWTDQNLSNIIVTPQANQVRQLTLVVVHLEYPKVPSPSKDESLPAATMISEEN
jgi:hypothetical protein